MINATQREKEFRDDLQALCDKHGAELKITDDGRDYGMHSGVCIVSMSSVWEKDACLKEFCEFNL